MTQINRVINYIYNKKKGMIGFTLGPRLVVRAKSRKSFKFALRAAMTPPSGFEGRVSLVKGGKKREIRL